MSEVDDGHTIDRAAEAAYAKDQAPWEPKEPWAWYEIDPLRAPLAEAGIKRDESERGVMALHAAWMRLPRAMRAQVFLEREISAALATFLPELAATIPDVYSVGVALRGEVSPRLCAVVTVERALTPGERGELQQAWDGRSKIASRAERFEESAVPIVVEVAQAPVALGSVPTGGYWLGRPNPPPAAAPVMQSGDRIDSQSPSGIREPGTLTCIVSTRGTSTPLALSSGHVFLRKGYDVVSQRNTPVRVGRVAAVDADVDAGYAELDEPYLCDYRLKVCDLVPAPPVIAPAGLPVQMYGAVSLRKTGYVNQTNVIPTGATTIGLLPAFTADIVCAHGDSGALLVSGLDARPPFTSKELEYMAPQYADSMTCAMVGMLKAGPSADADPRQRPQAYFIPIIEVFRALGIEPWTRESALS